MLSIETTTKLLKLHLKWPEREDHHGKGSEPLEFFKWLSINHHDKPEVTELNCEELVEEFLSTNSHVLWPSMKDEQAWANLRLEPRIENDVRVDMMVVNCDDLEMIGTSVFGRTLDLGLHGLRVTISETLPRGAIVKTVVTSNTDTERRYELDAEVRWSTTLEDGHLIGIKLSEEADFDSWQENFGVEFVAPVMKNKRTEQDNGT